MSHCSATTLNHLLVQVCHAHRTRAGELFSDFGLHVGQERILMALYEEDGLTLSQLADKLAVQPPTVTRMARRMGKNGLLTRRNCSEDGRVFRIYLTGEGRALKGQLDRAWADLVAQTTQALTNEQKKTLHQLLEHVRGNLSAGGA